MSSRVVKAVHGVQQVTQDSPDEIAESSRLREREPRDALVERYAAAAFVDSTDGARQRRLLLRALCKSFGHGVRIGLGVLVLLPPDLPPIAGPYPADKKNYGTYWFHVLPYIEQNNLHQKAKGFVWKNGTYSTVVNVW